MYFVISRQGNAEKQETPVGTSGQVQASIERRIDSTELQSKLQIIVNNYPEFDIGIAFVSPQLGDPIAIDGEIPFVAASTTKVITAAYALHQAQLGNVSLNDIIGNDTLNNNIRNMIVHSDNDAWAVLLEYFAYDNITNFGNKYGAVGFDSIQNTINASAMASFMSVILSEGVLTNEYSSLLKDFMVQSDTGPITLEPRFLPLIKKAGWLDDRLHLTGIIESDSRSDRLAFAVYIKSKTDASYPFSSGSNAINEILNVAESALR